MGRDLDNTDENNNYKHYYDNTIEVLGENLLNTSQVVDLDYLSLSVMDY